MTIYSVVATKGNLKRLYSFTAETDEQAIDLAQRMSAINSASSHRDCEAWKGLVKLVSNNEVISIIIDGKAWQRLN